jgi:hypothetical protein
VLAAAVVVCGVVGLLMMKRRKGRLDLARMRTSRAFWCISIALAAAQVFLAVAALGPVTGYDTGLYHLGAVQYSADFSAIPGLANLYGPLGYGSMEFPLAGLLQNGPWSSQGFRLLNGLLMGLVAVDLALRVARRHWSVGTYVLIVAVTAAWIPMIALSDFWVTSPSQDSSVLSLTLVAVAYLSDLIGGKSVHRGDAAVAVACSLLTWLIRPTMAIFTLALVLTVLAALCVKFRQSRSDFPVRLVTVMVTAGLAALTVSTLRDYRLSGWLQYPLSLYAFDVPWLASDPMSLRLATLGFHRDPSNIWEASSGWSWISPWFSRLPRQWEAYELLTMLAAAVALVIICLRATAIRAKLTPMLFVMLPSAASIAAWWVFSPPSFRFSWGPLFTFFAVPIGWSLWLLVTHREHGPRWRVILVGGMVVPIALVVTFSAMFRLHLDTRVETGEWSLGVDVPYSYAPVQTALVTERELESGIQLRVPKESELCWSSYPLCSPDAPATLRYLGDGIQHGFSH